MALVLVVLTVAASASALAYHRQVSRCPNPWHRHGGRCYRCHAVADCFQELKSAVDVVVEPTYMHA